MEIDLSRESVPDATTLLKFRHLLQANDYPAAGPSEWERERASRHAEWRRHEWREPFRAGDRDRDHDRDDRKRHHDHWD